MTEVRSIVEARPYSQASFTDEKGVSRKILMPVHQLVAYQRYPRWANITNPTVSPTFFSGGTPISWEVPVAALVGCKHLELRIGVTVANAPVTPAAMPYWFNRIEVKQNNGDLLLTLLPQAMEFGMIAGKIDSQLKPLLKNAAYGYTAESMFDRHPQLEVGNHEFELPLIGSWLDQNVYIANITGGNLTFVLYPNNSGNLISGTQANFTVNSMRFVFETEALGSEDALDLYSNYSRIPKAYNYLEATEIVFQGQTLTAATKYNLDLDTIKNRSAAFGLLYITANGATNANNGLRSCISIGDGTFDVTEADGTSLLGGGTAIDAEFLRNEAYNFSIFNSYNSSWGKAPYVIPFCYDIPAALRGSMSGGYMDFGDTKRLLAITPGPAQVNEVQRITLSAQPASGFFRLKFGESMTAPLAAATSTANLKVAFDALPAALRFGITATFSAAFSAGTTVDVTLTQTNGELLTPDQRVQVMDSSLLTAGSAQVSATTSIQTRGNEGFISGTYDIRFIVFCYSRLHSIGGNFSRRYV